jgi:DNA-binding transcriptional regulator GbsR (MarR family)
VESSDQRTYDPAVSAFVEAFAADLTEAGMPRMPSRVFACLLAEDSGVLSAAELAERLQISPAAVSGAVRYLAQVHMVSREREPGSRRERYRVHADIWYEAFANRDQQFGRWDSSLRRGIEAVGPGTPAGQRIEETAEFFAFIKEELGSMMDRWRAHRAQRSAE